MKKDIRDISPVEQLVKVPPSTTETTVKITIPLPFPIEQSGGTPINQPPSVTAGQDQELTLPTNQSTLRGVGFDSDGNVVAYHWQQTGGPGGATIVTPNQATTIIDNLIEGTFEFMLTVTDNNGATAFDNVIVIVHAAQDTNQPPQVSAGQDMTITLPTNSVLLDGTASDPDGTIASFNWTKQSGGAASIQNPNAVDTQVTGLVEGSYVFQLEVTDNAGAKAHDSMIVTVKAAVTPPSPTTPEGFGKNAIGGANSSNVYHVTNLNQSGAGSLSAGIGSNKTIVFDVSGKIKGRFDLINISYLTIDGSGRDITIDNNNNGDGVSFDGANTHHCILRNITVTNAGNDGINVLDGAHDILIDHCSAYDNRDGNIDVAGGENVSIQWSLIGSHIVEVGGTLVTAKNVSIHHCLYSPASPNAEGERCPMAHCNYSPPGNPNVDFRNNLVWKYGRNGGTGSGYGTSVSYNACGNVVNNYYYAGNSQYKGNAICKDDGYGSGNTGKIFASGNVSGWGNNPNGISNHDEFPIPDQYKITMQPACDAAQLVLDNAAPRPLNTKNKTYFDAITSLPNCNAAASDENVSQDETNQQ